MKLVKPYRFWEWFPKAEKSDLKNIEPEASVGDSNGALHWYREAELIRILDPDTGQIDVAISEELFSKFLTALDRHGFPELESIRDAAFEDGRAECESEHDDA